MKLNTSAVVVYILFLMPCCIICGPLVCTQFRLLRLQRIDKVTKRAVKTILECAVNSLVEGESRFSYNPHLRLCVTGAPANGPHSTSVLTDGKNSWLLYFKQAKVSLKQGRKFDRSMRRHEFPIRKLTSLPPTHAQWVQAAAIAISCNNDKQSPPPPQPSPKVTSWSYQLQEQPPGVEEEKVVVLYHVVAENGTLVLFRHHVALLNRETPSAEVGFNASVLIPDAKTVCYNKANNKLFIVYKRQKIQELFSREGIQGTDVLETRINGTICGEAKQLFIDNGRQEFFILTDKGICVWGDAFPQRLLIEHKQPWRMQLNTHKTRIYWIDGKHNKELMFSTYQASPLTPVCVSRDMLGLAVDREGTYYTCSLHGGIRRECRSTVILGGRKKWQECVSMTAWGEYLFMVNNKGEMEFVSLKKKVRLRTEHYSVAITRGAYSKHPYNIQVLQDN